MRPGRAVVAALSASVIAACSGAPASEEASGDVLVAVSEDFRGYHGWTAYDVTYGAAEVGITDGSTLTAYLSAPPPSGSTEFPVGTIIVKEATGGTEVHQVMAMVKRGGGYNKGAPGWEWFEIEGSGDGKDGVRIVWRGVGPPAGEMYGGDPNAGCNTCHSVCGNDSVCSKPLDLTTF